jgi:hypothetical protein
MGVGIKIGGEVAFPSAFLGAEDLKGKDVTVEIESVTFEDVPMNGGGNERKVVMRFKGAKKAWILNRTNAKTIKSMYGPMATDAEQDAAVVWPGKKITLYPTTTRAFGEVTDCVRVRKAKV